MKFLKSGLIVLIILPFSLFSQNLIDLCKHTDISERRPIPYQHVREADIAWTKIVWRRINLREKMNLSLYYPTFKRGTQMNLMNLILHGIENEGLQAYDPSYEGEFVRPMTFHQIRERCDALPENKLIVNPENNEEEEVIIPKTIDVSEVKDFILKELWFFDKQRSTMDVRIVGICPVRTYYMDSDAEMDNPLQQLMFWVYFPDFRKIFANHDVYNAVNVADRITYDEFFFKRFFSGTIIKESNLFNDRYINDYLSGKDCLYEAERIHNEIFNFEQDMWQN